MVTKIPKRCHMVGYNVKTSIKTSKILQNYNSWTFVTFLFILIVTQNLKYGSIRFLWSQGFQKGITCRVSMVKTKMC